MGILVFIAIFVVVIALVVYGVVAKHKREQAMAAFAQQQGWTALGNNVSSLSQYLPTFLLNRGQNPTYDMAYQATLKGVQLVFFQYRYTEYHEEYDSQTNTMEQRAQNFYFTVVHASLAHPVPTVTLLHHTLLGKLADIGEHTGLTKLTLEGDFNKDFDTYMLPNNQVDSLSLLTPDVMELLQQAKDNKASMSFVGQSLAVSIETTNLSPTTIQPLLQYVLAITEKVDAKPAPSADATSIVPTAL